MVFKTDSKGMKKNGPQKYTETEQKKFAGIGASMQTRQGGGKVIGLGCWEARNIQGRFRENEVSVSRGQFLTCASQSAS